MLNQATCELCGEPMPAGEEMFKYHGYSGNCPKPPKPKAAPELPDDLRVPLHELRADLDWIIGRIRLEHFDDEVCGMLKESIRNRLSQIEEASYRLLPS